MSEKTFVAIVLLIVGILMIAGILSAWFGMSIIFKTAMSICLIGIGATAAGYGGVVIWKAAKPFLGEINNDG